MIHPILRKLILIAVLLTGSHAFAHDFEVDGIYYNILSSTDKTVEVTYRGSHHAEYTDEYTGSIVIPESIIPFTPLQPLVIMLSIIPSV